MGTATSGSSRFPSRLRRVARFAVLWWGCFVGILMMAGVEAGLLWQRGIRYTPASSFGRVWASHVSFDANGISAAAIVAFKQNSQEGCWRDVVLLRLRRGGAVPLGVRSLQPQDVAIAPGGNAVAIVCGDGSIHAVSDLFNVTAEATMPRSRLFARSEDRNVARLVFSPDGSRLAAIGECSVTVWQWPDGTRLRHDRRRPFRSLVSGYSACRQPRSARPTDPHATVGRRRSTLAGDLVLSRDRLRSPGASRCQRCYPTRTNWHRCPRRPDREAIVHFVRT